MVTLAMENSAIGVRTGRSIENKLTCQWGGVHQG
jgi:hypothetical protein